MIEREEEGDNYKKERENYRKREKMTEIEREGERERGGTRRDIKER